jgi:hypothetical protein
LLRSEPRLVIPVSRTEVSGLRAALGIKAQREAVKA